ncbi:CpsD/CapB family tyrosine-protein kinase, partial [cf. Phormidesmis sp. LEGE 11477]|uniref:CpsD/CapB family tyrosine-protein kinase n=1 Tax=cf. Phormidesmis sp. LEGE 11477 TaxID=1828680 RepID=UPI00187DE15C
ILIQPESDYHSSYERLLSKLRLLRGEDEEAAMHLTGPKVMALTSIQGHEGKSLSAYNIAIASARAGRRTLLIEADFRAPSQAARIGIDFDPQAASEPLRYYGAQVGNSIQMVFEVENLYISPSPGPQPQPTAIIESSEMQRFLRDARARFDMVILDTPPLSCCEDALLLEPYTDGLILVARPGITEKAELDSTLETMEFSEDMRLLGVLINAASTPVETKTPAAEVTQAEPLETSPEPWSAQTVTSSRIDF